MKIKKSWVVKSKTAIEINGFLVDLNEIEYWMESNIFISHSPIKYKALLKKLANKFFINNYDNYDKFEFLKYLSCLTGDRFKNITNLRIPEYIFAFSYHSRKSFYKVDWSQVILWGYKEEKTLTHDEDYFIEDKWIEDK